MRIDTWTSGYKVEAADWYDGKRVYLGIRYYRPGSGLSRPPCWEKSFLLDADGWPDLNLYLDSVVNHLSGLEEHPCMLSYYRDGKEVYRRMENACKTTVL